VIAADYAIARTRRDLTVGSVIRYALVVGAAAAVLLTGVKVGVVFLGLAAAWVAMAYRTAVGSRLAAESPALIAAGQYDEAERRIEQAVRSFIPSRAAKVTTLHHLAVLRYAQGRWAESAALCRAVLRFKPTAALGGVLRASRLTLAEALLESGDVRGAHDAIAGLYGQRLALSEAMKLLAVQLDYESRVGAWEQMIQGVAGKVQLAELLPAGQSARAQAMLALAARRTGRPELAQFLRRRAELLADAGELAGRRRVLSELWPGGGEEDQSPADVGTKMDDEAAPRDRDDDGPPAAAEA
jgi:tetratricopeptide (TPR) repeat protein